MPNRIRLVLAATAVALLVLLLPAVALAADGSTTSALDWRAVLLVAVPVLLYVARALSGTADEYLIKLLPWWCDVTTWPRWAQPVLPFILAAAPPLVADLQTGEPILASLQAALTVGLGAIGFYHAGKRVLGSGTSTSEAYSRGVDHGIKAATPISGHPNHRDDPRLKRSGKPPLSAAMLFLLVAAGLLSSGCFIWSREAANAVDSACQLSLIDSPEVQASAAERGVPVAEIAALLCATPAVYDAWEAAHNQRQDPATAAVREAESRGLL